MKKTFTIKTIKEREEDDKFNPGKKCIKYSYTTEEKPDIFGAQQKGKWNSNWAVGTKVEFEDDQYKSWEWEGKTFFRIGAPPEAMGNFINAKEITERLDSIEERLSSQADRIGELESK